MTTIVAMVLVLTPILPGCGATPHVSEGEKVAVQEAQLQEHAERADAWGGEILDQIPASEIESISDNAGGSRQVSEYYEEWPKYYYWAQIAVLKAEGARTPTQTADDLDPWLEQQGWERNVESEFPARRDSFARSYFRDGYHLTVEVYTEAPPRAQSLHFTIVTPHTDPDR